MNTPQASTTPTGPSAAIRIEEDGVFQRVPTLANKVWISFLSVAIACLVLWKYTQTNDWSKAIAGGGLGFFFLTMEWFRFAMQGWRPSHRRGRPVIRLDSERRLLIQDPSRWPSQRTITLDETPLLTIHGGPGKRLYAFGTRDPSRQLFPTEIQPKWGKEIEGSVEQWLRGLELKGLLTIQTAPAPDNFFAQIRGDR